MNWTLTIRDTSCTLRCSDGRHKTFQTLGRHDPRINEALFVCAMHGFPVKVENEA